ncbi:unnamed protein product [Paramecium octaurelia]|uniref:Uncharacterized protein n=1 Tax=Paramecium octaurelia TaxID=43137 RepID=A0A8S1Y6R2_PAROT|nr:unnamed protein product [Paramecium octaurelia]
MDSSIYNVTIFFFGQSVSLTLEKNTTTLELYEFLALFSPEEFEKVRQERLRFFLPAQNLFLQINQLTFQPFFHNQSNYILELKIDLDWNDQHQQNEQYQTNAQQQVQQQQLYTQNQIQNNNQQNQQFQQNHQTQCQQNQQLNQQGQNQSCNQQQQYQQQSMQENNKNNVEPKKWTLTLQYKQNQIEQIFDNTLTVGDLFAFFISYFGIQGDLELFYQDFSFSWLKENEKIFDNGIQNNSRIEGIDKYIEVMINIYDGNQQFQTFKLQNISILETINYITKRILSYTNLKEETASVDLFLDKENKQQDQDLENESKIKAVYQHCTLKELKLLKNPLKLKARIRYHGGSNKGILN